MNKSLRILFLINGIFILAANLIGPLFAIFIESKGGTIITVSLTWAMMLFATTLTTIALSSFGDRVKEHEYYLAIGYLLRAFGWLGFVFADSLAHILILQFVIGVGEALGSTGFDAVFAEHLKKGHQVRSYATWRMLSNIILIVSTIVGGVVVERYGFSPLFIFMSLSAFFCATLIYRLPRKLL